MKKAIIIIFCLLFLGSPGFTQDRKCEECPDQYPYCGYTRPAGDGCNTCSCDTYCIDGKWYTRGHCSCTLAACIKQYEIENPFKKR